MNSQAAPLSPFNPSAISKPLLRIDSQHILQGAMSVEIEHAGQRYVLRVTRENKLILTK